MSLQNQCAQLDTANRAWQTFYDQQINSLKETFKNHVQLSDDPNFEQIIQSVVAQLGKYHRERECHCYCLSHEHLESNETDQLRKQLTELQETNNLLIDTNQNLTYRLNQTERPSSPFISQENLRQTRRTPIQDVRF